MGCGTGANIRLLIEEGFDVYGLDFSDQAIRICERLYPDAVYSVADMMNPPFPDSKFDCVVDVFSTFCLDEKGFSIFLSEVKRILKRGGHFFSYTPSKASDAWNNYLPAKRIDNSTLDGIRRDTSPYYGNFYNYRFIEESDIKKICDKSFELVYSEKVGRTYRNGQEYFEFLVFELRKK